jgi:hypothetical protein
VGETDRGLLSVPSRYFYGGNEEKRKNLVRTVGVPTRIQTEHFRNVRHKRYHLEIPYKVTNLSAERCHVSCFPLLLLSSFLSSLACARGHHKVTGLYSEPYHFRITCMSIVTISESILLILCSEGSWCRVLVLQSVWPQVSVTS